MKKMFWVDMEMSGLDERVDRILEVAVIITDYNFVVLETYHRVVYQPQEVLDTMNDWCKENHAKSGLSPLVPKGTPLSLVEKELIDITNKHFEKNEKIVVCGNSVGMDKRFIDVHMPEFAKRTHYRILDVTAFKEYFRSKYNLQVHKAKGHRALDDVRESIGELQYYSRFVDECAIKTALSSAKKNSR